MLDKTNWAEKIDGVVKVDLKEEKFDAKANLDLYVKGSNDTDDYFRNHFVEIAHRIKTCEEAKDIMSERIIKNVYYETMRLVGMTIKEDEDSNEFDKINFDLVSKYNEGFLGHDGKLHHVHGREFYYLCDGDKDTITEMELRFDLRYDLWKERAKSLIFGVNNVIILEHDPDNVTYVNQQRDRKYPIYGSWEERGVGRLLHVELANRVVDYLLDKTAKTHGWDPDDRNEGPGE